jgi:hypothetical protein
LTNLLAGESAAQNTYPSPNLEVAEGLIKFANRTAPAEEARFLITAIELGSDASCRRALAKELASVTRRLTPKERTRLCSRAAKVLVDALKRETDTTACGELALGLNFLLMRLNPESADRMVSPVLERIRNATFMSMEDGLWALAGRLAPTEAAQKVTALLTDYMNGFFRGAAEGGMDIPSPPGVNGPLMVPMSLASTIEWTNSARLRNEVMTELNEVVVRMGPAEAANFCNPAGDILSTAVNHGSNSEVRAILGAALSVVARGMDRDHLLRMCRQVSSVLVHDLKRETKPVGRGALAEALAALAGRLGQGEAARVCDQASQVLADALGQEMDPVGCGALAKGIAMLAARMDRTQAARLAAQTVFLAKQKEFSNSEETLSSLVG